jgi:prefoldin subunit 5
MSDIPKSSADRQLQVAELLEATNKVQNRLSSRRADFVTRTYDDLTELRRVFEQHIGLMASANQEIDRLNAKLVECMESHTDLERQCDLLQDDLARLRKELAEACNCNKTVTRTPEVIGGVACERISGLDVIVTKGLIPAGEQPRDIRAYGVPFTGRWLNSEGYTMRCGVHTLPGKANCTPASTRGLLLVLLEDKPREPVTWETREPVTWETSLPDGDWCADDLGFKRPVGPVFGWQLAAQLLPKYSKPAVPGRYRFKNGVGTLIV